MDKILMERRKFMRFRVPLDLEFKLQNDRDGVENGVVVNFSREGFCFESGISDFDSKEDIEFNIKMPDKDDHVSVIGDVVWTEKAGAGCLAGVKMKEMNREAKSEILDFAYDLWLERMKD